MARTAQVAFWTLLLVGMSLSHNVVEQLLKRSNEDTIIMAETSTLLEDGEQVLETSATDKNCHARVMTSNFDDDTANTLVDDLDDNQGLMLFSEAPDVCYIRSLKDEKSKCRGGYETIKKGETSGPKKTFYVDGPQLKLTDLAESLQKLCENRTIIQLVPKSPNDVLDVVSDETNEIGDDEGNDATRMVRSLPRKAKKCSIEYQECLEIKKNCKLCCNGWWPFRDCSYCCEKFEHCKQIGARNCK